MGLGCLHSSFDWLALQAVCRLHERSETSNGIGGFMSVASVPFLITIITAIGTFIKTCLDIAAKAASRAAFYFATIVPMLLKWFLTSRAFMLAVVVALGVSFVATFRTAFAVFNNTIALADRWNWFFGQFQWMTFILWDGPLNIREMYNRIPDILGVWTSLNVLRFLFVKLGWVLEVSRRNITFS